MASVPLPRKAWEFGVKVPWGAAAEPLLGVIDGDDDESDRRAQSVPPEGMDSSDASHLPMSPFAGASPMMQHRYSRFHNNPLAPRSCQGRRKNFGRFTALGGGNAMCEEFTFPHLPVCAQCNEQLGAAEMRWGTGLCTLCYEGCPKDCGICKKRLKKKQLQWGTGLCDECYDACEKVCRICDKSLGAAVLHWRTGLCDSCYNECEKQCKMCQKDLSVNQLRWGTGLCDECYGSVQKACRICDGRIQDRQLRWHSGLCDSCYDDSEKLCFSCDTEIALGSLHWRTGLCDKCYDKRSGECKNCRRTISKNHARFGTGLCDKCYEEMPEESKKCVFCTERIGSKALHWGTGLCVDCYNKHGKQCKLCHKNLPFGQRKYGSGLCDACYDGCERTCRMCSQGLPLGQLHWGTRLCDACFDKCTKECSSCKSTIQIGELHWGTGACNRCYDQTKGSNLTEEVIEATKEHKPPSLSRGVRAVIVAQFVFYVAPGALQPSLYLHIQALDYQPSTTAVFAAVLTTASFFSMLAPVPLGMWADYRGEREVYCGVTLVGGLAAILFLWRSPASIFAVAWGLLNIPPAVRGVRATYFSKHVRPEDLSRAGQLASSFGLLGGFMGPFLSVFADAACGASEPGLWLDGFTAMAIFGLAMHVVCAVGLAWAVAPRTLRARDAGGGGWCRAGRTPSAADLFATCEKCCQPLNEREVDCSYLLCNRCYDTFGGDNLSFKQYTRRVLWGFCAISLLLEVSMNAGVIATFQPIAVMYFGWGNDAIAAVNFVGAGLSVVISLLMAWLRMPERSQVALAAGLYVVGVTVFTLPPMREWRAVVGLMLGIKAQILFMAPFTAIFSRLIGRARMTNNLSTALCLAPAIGAALGTVMAPAFVSVAGTMAFSLAATPAIVSVGCIAWAWHWLEGVPKPAAPPFPPRSESGGLLACATPKTSSSRRTGSRSPSAVPGAAAGGADAEQGAS